MRLRKNAARHVTRKPLPGPSDREPNKGNQQLAGGMMIEDLVVGYGGGDVVRGVSFEIAGASITSVIGPNGAGKSTLLSAIVGLLRPRAGRVLLDGQDITGIGPRQALAAGVVIVPQSRSIFPDMSVQENVRMGGYTLNDRVVFQQRLEMVSEICPVVIHSARIKAGRLSGGQQRMVEFARSLMLDPRVVLLDEPSMGLDPSSLRTVFDCIAEMRARGKTVVLVEQNAKAALQLADKAVVLEGGRLRLTGTGREILQHSEIGKVYLGGGVTSS